MQVKLQDERVISLGIWDTAGAERFQSISRMYYHGSGAAVICFYPGSQQSFAKAKFWVSSIMLFARLLPDQPVWFKLQCYVIMEAQCMVAGSNKLLSMTRRPLMCMQAQEVKHNEPNCKIYFAMTMCDLLDQPPGIGTDGSSPDPSPQDSGDEHPTCSHMHI